MNADNVKFYVWEEHGEQGQKGTSSWQMTYYGKVVKKLGDKILIQKKDGSRIWVDADDVEKHD